jgi:hypothetical protein
LIDNPSSTFFFRYSGELSSSEIDFNEGDVLVVDRSKTPNKKTKYVIIEDQEGFHLISGKNLIQKIDNHKNININEFKSERIFGVVTALIRKY